MEDVEVRNRSKRKSEERPKPVLGSYELDPKHELKHDLRIEQGHAVCFDKDIYIDDAEQWATDNSEHSDLENDMKERLESECINRRQDGSQISTNNIYVEIDKTKISCDSMEIIGSQDDISTKISIDTNDDRKLSHENNIYNSESCDCEKEVNENICKEEETEFESKHASIDLKFEIDGSKNCDNAQSGDLSQISGSLSNEMYPCNRDSQDLSISEHNRSHNQEVCTLRNYTCNFNISENCATNNEEEHIYVDMNFSNKIYENVVPIKSPIKEDDHIHLCVPNLNTDIPLLSTTTLNKKVIHKEGFLQKQGGVDRNQGWKKRWFVLDERSLKYYRDRKSSVSLRIIPVALMRSVTPVNDNRPKSSASPANVSDLFVTSGRQYQFTLECKQRIFQFGTDSLENCQQWQSSLMAAIIEYQKDNKTDLPYGGEMNLPDISGSVKFDNNKNKYFVAIKGKLLRYYQNLEDYSVDCPIHELSMERTSVKEIRKTALQLDSPPDQKFVLTFELETDCQQWKTYIEAAISRALGDDKVLERVWQSNDNKICADCYAPDPEWASINLGIVICTKCAGPHRSLGVRRSKVRSLRMDNLSKENENIVKILETIGNRKGNQFWCQKLEETWIINDQTPSVIRQKFIEEKYLKKKFADILRVDSQEEVNMALYSAVEANDVMTTMKALFSGADINAQCAGQEKTIIELANESSSPVLKEFLEQNRNTDVSTALNGDVLTETSLSESSRKIAIYQDGYLHKTGPNLKSYDERWCVLHYGRITYFSKKEGSPKGYVDLADATSVSVVTGQRKYSFDISMQTKDRTYRFAAQDETMFRKWLNVIIQVICPLEFRFDRSTIAGYFYFKKQLTYWAKVWLDLDNHAIHIRHRDDSNIETIQITSRMKCMQYNVGCHSEKAADVRQFDNNQTVELISDEGHVVAYFQGMTLKDTRKLLILLELAISGR